jgi:hypothetical protein
MIDGAMLKRINDEQVGDKDPDQVCAELGIDPAGAREAVEGITFGLRLPPEGVGTVAIALFIGIAAGREDERSRR